MNEHLVAVRCPRCQRLAGLASEGAVLEVRCSRCKHDFQCTVVPAPANPR